MQLVACEILKGWRDEAHRVTHHPGYRVHLPPAEYVERSARGEVRELVPGTYQHRIRVVVTGPFEWFQRSCRAGDVIYLPVQAYRRYRGLSLFEREFERRTFRGRSYLHALQGCRSRDQTVKRGGCKKQRNLAKRQNLIG